MTLNKRVILFVEDELNLAEIVKESLEMRQFDVMHSATAKQGLHYFFEKKPDAIILDVMLPDGDGFEIARIIRQADKEVPIIFLTSKLLPQDVVEGFESGGNDYLKKPFSLEELIVRLKVMMSKNRLLSVESDNETNTFSLGRYEFYPHSGKLVIDSATLHLTARESQLLKILALNINHLVDRKTLLIKIWGNTDYFSGRSLDVFITKLRKHLSNDNSIKLINVRGIGYKLVLS